MSISTPRPEDSSPTRAGLRWPGLGTVSVATKAVETGTLAACPWRTQQNKRAVQRMRRRMPTDTQSNRAILSNTNRRAAASSPEIRTLGAELTENRQISENRDTQTRAVTIRVAEPTESVKTSSKEKKRASRIDGGTLVQSSARRIRWSGSRFVAASQKTLDGCASSNSRALVSKV